jgi:hypothetical protein
VDDNGEPSIVAYWLGPWRIEGERRCIALPTPRGWVALPWAYDHGFPLWHPRYAQRLSSGLSLNSLGPAWTQGALGVTYANFLMFHGGQEPLELQLYNRIPNGTYFHVVLETMLPVAAGPTAGTADVKIAGSAMPADFEITVGQGSNRASYLWQLQNDLDSPTSLEVWAKEGNVWGGPWGMAVSLEITPLEPPIDYDPEE